MSYNASIPAASDLLSQSQADILANFGQLNTQFGVDHTAFNAASLNGYHKKATLIKETVAPTFVTDTAIVYSKDDSSSNTQVFALSDSNTTYQLSGNSYTETTNGGSAGGTLYKVNLYTTAGERIVMYSGVTASTSAGAITFPEAYTVLYSVTGVSTVGGNLVITTAVLSTSGFSVVCRVGSSGSTNATTIAWTAIGRIQD
jgi:hypothetical protein